MEHNQLAADGTTFDNGYGICMIPRTKLTTATWNTDSILDGAYNSSTMHTSHLPGIVTKLQRVLGSHIVQRNVLLSSSVDRNGYSNAYTWTTAYATLMSIGQMTGTFTENENNYDDGKANYKLPIFNSKEYIKLVPTSGRGASVVASEAPVVPGVSTTAAASPATTVSATSLTSARSSI